MYANILNEIYANGLTIDNLAQKIDIAADELEDKILGISDFTLQEAIDLYNAGLNTRKFSVLFRKINCA